MRGNGLRNLQISKWRNDVKVKMLDGRITSKGRKGPGDVVDLPEQEAKAAIEMEAAKEYHPGDEMAEKAEEAAGSNAAAPAKSSPKKKKE